MDSSEMANLTVELFSHNSIMSDDFLGEVKFNMNSIPLDEVFDTRLELKPRTDKKGRVSGHLHIRFYHSIQEDLRPRALITDMVYYYKGIENEFKNGDLILYTGIGVPSALSQLATNSPFTCVGLVLKLPNKWTQKEEFYILEVTRNTDRFNDAFEEAERKGVMLFRMIERFHQCHGKTIWKCTLKDALGQELVDKMIKKMWEIHGENNVVSFSKEPTQAYETFSFEKFLLENFYFGKNKKGVFEWHDFVSPYVIAQILLEAGINITPVDKLVPHHLATSLFYDPKITLIRCAKSAMEIHGQEVSPQSKPFMLTGNAFGFPEPKTEIPKIIDPIAAAKTVWGDVKNVPAPQNAFAGMQPVQPLTMEEMMLVGATGRYTGLETKNLMRDAKGNIFVFQN